MSNARLEVEIGASIKEFQRKLADSLKGLKALKDENKNLEKSFKDGKITADKYYSALAKNTVNIQKATQRVSKYKKGITGVDNSMGGLKKSTANAVPAVTEFSRVIQDAPFGIQGVANNITQLTQNFGYLKNQTGSTSSAFKAMLGTLTGPAGILLAVSAVTSIMVTHGDVILNLIKGNNDLAKSQKAVTSALNDFYGGQVTKIQSYISILGEANTSETQRKELTEELIRLVPSLKKEDFNYGTNLDIVRKKIGQYVLAQASRIEADTLVQENSKKLAKLSTITSLTELAKIKKEAQGTFTKLSVDKNAAKRLRKSLKDLGYWTGKWVSGIETELSDIELVNFANNIKEKLTKELKPVKDRIDELYGNTFEGNLTKAKTAFEKLKEKQETLRKSLQNSILTKGETAKETLKLGEEYKATTLKLNNLSKAVDLYNSKTTKPQKNVFVEERQVKFNEEILETVNIGQSDSEKEWNTINWDEYYNLKAFDNQRNLLTEKMLQLSQTTDSLINQSISSSFNSLANNISNSLGRSAGFFGVFAGEIIKIGGRMLIAQLTQDKAKMVSNLAVSKTNAVRSATETASKTPYGAFLLPALITTGVAAVSSAFGKIGTNAGSSDVGGGRNFSSGFSGGYSSNQPQRIELFARGEELYGVLDSFLRRNGNQGGNLSLS